MARKRYGTKIRTIVEKLRQSGKTYAEIRSQYPIPKSTLSLWLGKKYPEIFTRKMQLQHLKKIRVSARESIQRLKKQREARASESAHKVLKTLHLKDAGMRISLLAMLYWSEGTKAEGSHGLRFVNTDPRLIVLFMTLLRSSFTIDESRLRIRLHVHHYHNLREATAFWSKLLHVSPTQFWKPYRKPRNKEKRHRRNFKGICFIYYPGHYIRKELLEIGYGIHAILSDRLP